jgi:DNA-binding transcriptional ArsR family regulator
MSFASDHPKLTAPAALRALGHPTRLRILGRLQLEGDATATECAQDVGESPSSCSYHLRTLARHGFVEEAPSDDGRERRWRARVVGVDFPSTGDPEFEAASELARAALLQLDDDEVRAYLERERSFSRAWRDAASFRKATIVATPRELERIAEQIDELLEPYYRHNREDLPRGARQVHVGLRAVPRP